MVVANCTFVHSGIYFHSSTYLCLIEVVDYVGCKGFYV